LRPSSTLATTGAAYRAIGALAANPDEAVALLNGRLHPLSEAEARPVRRLLADLGSEDFATREKGTRELHKLHAEWLPLFHAALVKRPPLEVHRRIDRLLADPRKTRWSSDMLRRLRAVQVLEEAGTPEARRLLRRLAKGVPEARLTQDAQDALRRRARPAE
jgi:hypothetical protein